MVEEICGNWEGLRELRKLRRDLEVIGRACREVLGLAEASSCKHTA
jgi:hypothetical protein